jgi:hypothetical protein
LPEQSTYKFDKIFRINSGYFHDAITHPRHSDTELSVRAWFLSLTNSCEIRGLRSGTGSGVSEFLLFSPVNLHSTMNPYSSFAEHCGVRHLCRGTKLSRSQYLTLDMYTYVHKHSH